MVSGIPRRGDATTRKGVGVSQNAIQRMRVETDARHTTSGQTEPTNPIEHNTFSALSQEKKQEEPLRPSQPGKPNATADPTATHVDRKKWKGRSGE